jgi:nitroreductase
MKDADILQRLASRFSVGARHLVEPGPSDEQLLAMTTVAMRAPDHAELAPYRFQVIRGDTRGALARLFEQAARDAGKDAAAAAMDAERAAAAPVTVAVTARIDLGHPIVPAHEQWAAVGGAIANLLNAAHLLGYAGKMLSGAKVRDLNVARAFCAPGETLVGWVVLGTPRLPPSPRRDQARKPPPDQVIGPWVPKA